MMNLPQEFLWELDASADLAVHPNTIRKARTTGALLCGVPLPEHILISRRVAYRRRDWDEFKSQLFSAPGNQD